MNSIFRNFSLMLVIFLKFEIFGVVGYDWEFQRYDGWYNNLAHPEWGTAGSRLYRQVPSSYMDGVYMINDSFPSARLISDIVFKGPDGLANRRNVTTMLAFFSQVVAYEIMQASDAMCPLEMHKVQVGTCDPVFDTECRGKTMMPFIRARYDPNTGQGLNSPREQINARTSWIDASFLYSTQEPWVHALRSFVNGTLREGPMPNYPPFNAQRLPLINPPPPQVHRLVDPERLFMLGDARINENPALLSFGLMLFRWHNVQASRLKTEHPDWTDEQIFERARRWVIATLQNIIMYEFLPALLGEPIGPYQGYNPNLPPGVSHLFAAAAFRYPHTLVPPGMFLRDASCHYHEKEGAGGYSAIRLCNTWWNSQEVIQRYSMDAFVLGMASQIAERDDNVVVSDLRDFVFGPLHFSRRDLVALTIMRGRDNGLSDYNTVRKAFGFEPIVNWTNINPQQYAADPQVIDKLSKLHDGDINRLDFYVGGILESNGDKPGPLFLKIIKEQFERLRHADRFWFENRENELFSDSEIHEIYNIRLSDIIVATTNIQRSHLQKNVFFWHDGDPCPQPYQLNSSHLEPCIPFMRYDHFMGNEVAFIYTCIVLGAIPLVCIAIGYWMIKRRQKLSVSPNYNCKLTPPPSLGKSDFKTTTMTEREPVQDDDHSILRPFKNNQIFTIEKTGINAVWFGPAIEWLHENYSRSITVILDNRPAVHLTKRRGGVLRCVGLEDVYTLVMYKSEAGFVRLELPKDYDMVLRFESYSVCEKFTVHLDEIMRQQNKQLRISYTSTERLLATAETREKRQQKLEHFFREAYAKAFRFLPMSNRHTLYDDVSESVLRTSLTRVEFAEALGMQENDLFIQRMFTCVARTNEDKICFQDFLDTVIKFANGTMEEKLKIFYFLCDRDNNGLVDREEFCQFLRSIVTAAGTPLSISDQDELLHQILYNAGIPKQKPYLTRKDFDAILTDVTTKNKPVGLHLKGRKQTYFNNNYLAEQISVDSFSVPAEEEESAWAESYRKALSWLEDYRQQVTCLLIFFMLMMAAFLERFWHYSTMSEHRDLRRVMGYSIAVTRGAAAAISFCLAVILLTICRNVITKLRETPLNHYIPFDSAISFHKIIGITVGIFAVIHSAGHCINFYHVSTQDLEGLQCLFQEAVFSSDFQPSITYWFFGTVTGITGILLVAVMSIMYVFSAPSIVHSAYHAFRITHFLNILLYALTIAHGLPKLLDAPIFWKYISGPAIVLAIDRLISCKQEYRKLEIVKASMLPSDVTYIKFKRPRNFNFRSGQWVRIRCPAFSCSFNEWHAFSLASAPQDPTLEIYVKAQGPWTWKLRHEIQPSKQMEGKYPLLHMDGPYGGGNQEWSNYEVAVMVGGGIGVTPYASILTDLVTATSGTKFSDVACKKVYFLWICPTQKNFEWFIEVLRKVEEADTKGVLETHIYITQFFHKFDLRTTMLYICEKHFRVNQGRSMFTNLKAVNHFGRPNLIDVFKHVQKNHENSRKIGVFSCGPRTLNRSVQAACEFVNSSWRTPNFIHRYETF